VSRRLPVAIVTIVGVVAILLAGAWIAPRLADAPAGGEADAELRLFPSGKLLEAVPDGFRTVGADLAWLEAVQYYGKHHMSDQTYPFAEHLFDVTTRLDPQFRNAYIFGGWVLGEEVCDMRAARSLFDRGTRNVRDDWMIAFQRGFLESMKGDHALGAIQMAHASTMDGAPPYAGRVAAFACTRAGREELAIRLWQAMEEDADPAIRALARERLRALHSGTRAGEDS
jgi:hypothetical protein